MGDADFEREMDRLFAGEDFAGAFLGTLLQLTLNPRLTLSKMSPSSGYPEDTRLTPAQVSTLVNRSHHAAESGGEWRRGCSRCTHTPVTQPRRATSYR